MYRAGTRLRSRPETACATPAEVMMAAAPQSSRMYWTSAAVRWLLMAVYRRPDRWAPHVISRYLGWFSMRMARASPGRNPAW